MTPTTLADLAEKFAALAIAFAKTRRFGSERADLFAKLLVEAISDELDQEEWIALQEDTLAIVKAAEKAR